MLLLRRILWIGLFIFLSPVMLLVTVFNFVENGKWNWKEAQSHFIYGWPEEIHYDPFQN